MSNRKTVRPADGRRVRKPDGSLLAEQGESVVWSSFWLRRHRDGDVALVDAKEPVVQQDAKPVKAMKGKESSQ
ncbi:MAG: DUF2635 domain-containing protein [Aeromonas veronii]